MNLISNRLPGILIFIGTLLLLGCAAEDSDFDLGQSALEATNECIAGCQKRGLDAATCAELCSSIGGEGCIFRCVEGGGEKERCTEGCAASGGFEICYDACIAKGGDDATCRQACARKVEGDGQGKKGVICTDGDQSIRDGITYLCENGAWIALDS
jgi:hypothetical protein